ncbi:MAG: type II restriction endonuclease [Bacteroidetes bacterium]|nr:MAG: type II restriction endonuclease [Bacteroidota bacterium]
MNSSIDAWLDSVSGNDRIWYAKRLSANDSGATASHQSGIYIPKPVLWTIFPSMKSGSNPDARFSAEVMPVGEHRTLRAIWYNEKSRNESRITQWNRPNRILEPDQTGAIILFAFQKRSSKGDAEHASIWLCQNEAEEEQIESIVGIVEPGEGTLHYPAGLVGDKPLFIQPDMRKDCSLTKNDIPDEWLANFPSCQELIKRALSMMPKSWGGPDTRLLARRECETTLFYSVERAFVLPIIKNGFSSVDEFVDLANSVTNRRKSRAGHSLELHLKEIFQEEGLSFSHGEVSEGNKKPDFIFPSIDAYRDPAWPEHKLRMLAAKTTCKDRWRQILNEANRIAHKHLVTLQQGVSENQFREMVDAGVMLVVPKKLHGSYPETVRARLQSLEQFIQETKSFAKA